MIRKKFLALMPGLLLLPCLFAIQSKAQTKTAMAFVETLFSDRNHEAAGFFDSSVSTKVSAKQLQDIVSTLKEQLGDFKAVLDSNTEVVNGNRSIYLYSAFTNDSLDVKVVFNKKEKIIGFTFIPHKIFSKDKGAGPGARELTINSVGVSLPGTWLTPLEANHKVLVVFVHGSGPNDRDETVHNNKPFKDIAVYLQANGISSYRFDKKTLVAPASFNKNFTIQDEVSNDVVNIINYFRSVDSLKDYKIVLIGHSLGGMMLPFIADTLGKKISAMIMMAANARPLQDLLLEQFAYLTKENKSPEVKKQYANLKEQVALLNAADLNESTPAFKLPLGVPASYWLSLRKYDPVKTFARLDIPVLLLQGKRDYQVKEKDYDMWMKAKGINKKYQGRSKGILYPALNHLFLEGTGKSLPAEYAVPSHVPVYVCKDITDWINKL